MIKNTILCLIAMLILLILCSCSEKTDPQTHTIEQVSMDKIILSLLSDLRVDPQNVRRVNTAEAIYYQIPMAQAGNMSMAAKVLDTYTKNAKFRIKKAKQPDNPEILLRAYYDPSKRRNYIIEFHSDNIPITTDTRTTKTAPRTPYSELRSPHTPQLCIIVDDFGSYDGPLLDQFCEIKPPITFAIIPGLPFSEIAMQKAIAAGHEVIVHMPMEPEDPNVNPGANAILHNMSSREIYNLVRSYFTELNTAVGANQHMGSRITQSKPLMRASLQYFRERGLFFIDSRTIASTTGREIASELGIPFAERDLFLDSPENTNEVLAQKIVDLQKKLEEKNRVLAITHCHDKERLQRLITFISEAQKMGCQIVPASKFVTRNYEV